MKKSWKQWMAIACALAMIVSLLPVTILAEEGVATPTDLAPIMEPAQETEPAEVSVEELAEEPAEEEKVTYTAHIAVVKRDGKILLTAVVEPEYTGAVIWEMKTLEADKVKWTVVESSSSALMILPGSNLIGKEIRFRLEDGTTSVLSYVVPEPEPVEAPEEVSEEGTDEPVVETNQEEPVEENEIEPAAEEAVEEPVAEVIEEAEAETESIPEGIAEESAEELVEEEQEIEEYETPLGLDDVIETEPEVQEEPAVEPTVEEPVPVVTEAEEAEDDVIIETFEIPAEEINVQPAAPVENEPEEIVIVEEIPEVTMDNAEEIDVREEADGMSAIFATLPANAEFSVLAVEGDWVMVVVNEQIGYIYKADLEGIIDLPEEEPDTAAPEMKVMIFSSRRTQMTEGETVYLTSKLVGLDGYEIEYQWECDKHDGAGFRDVEGANSDTYTFNATVETLSWDWRLSVLY